MGTPRRCSLFVNVSSLRNRCQLGGWGLGVGDWGLVFYFLRVNGKASVRPERSVSEVEGRTGNPAVPPGNPTGQPQGLPLQLFIPSPLGGSRHDSFCRAIERKPPESPPVHAERSVSEVEAPASPALRLRSATLRVNGPPPPAPVACPRPETVVSSAPWGRGLEPAPGLDPGVRGFLNAPTAVSPYPQSPSPCVAADQRKCALNLLRRPGSRCPARPPRLRIISSPTRSTSAPLRSNWFTNA